MALRGNKCIGIVKVSFVYCIVVSDKFWLTRRTRQECYGIWERRVPLCPQHVKELVSKGIRVPIAPVLRSFEFDDPSLKLCWRSSHWQVLVQPSNHRIYNDREYTKVLPTPDSPHTT